MKVVRQEKSKGADGQPVMTPTFSVVLPEGVVECVWLPAVLEADESGRQLYGLALMRVVSETEVNPVPLFCVSLHDAVAMQEGFGIAVFQVPAELEALDVDGVPEPPVATGIPHGDLYAGAVAGTLDDWRDDARAAEQAVDAEVSTASSLIAEDSLGGEE